MLYSWHKALYEEQLDMALPTFKMASLLSFFVPIIVIPKLDFWQQTFDIHSDSGWSSLGGTDVVDEMAGRTIQVPGWTVIVHQTLDPAVLQTASRAAHGGCKLSRQLVHKVHLPI